MLVSRCSSIVALRCHTRSFSRVRRRRPLETSGLSLPAALRELRETSPERKFDESIDVTLRMGLDPRKPDEQLRGVVELPHGTGKATRVAVFADGSAAAAATAAGADIVGSAALADRILKEGVFFERCLAHPDQMSVVGKLGRVLGPRGLMPNAKLGTITTELAEAVQSAKRGTIQYKAERFGLVSAPVGKASFGDEELLGNLRSFLMSVNDGKPSGAKGRYFLSCTLSSTMGPGIAVDVATVDPTSARFMREVEALPKGDGQSGALDNHEGEAGVANFKKGSGRSYGKRGLEREAALRRTR